MTASADNTRRDFLVKSAKLAAFTGLVTAGAGCSATGKGGFSRGPDLDVTAGPKPRSMGQNDVIRFGLIGIGGQGRHDLERLLKHKNISVKAIADPDPNNARMAAEMVKKVTGEDIEIYSGPDDWKNKLLTRDDIDAVLSATPCYMHGRVYLGCFAAGKHFYGEKPMCTEANEADALVIAERKNPNVRGQIGFQRRATQLYAEGVRRLQNGDVGDMVDGRGAWNNSWGPLGLPNEKAETWIGRLWLGRREYSGDWMLEQACHTWDVFAWVTGKPPIAASGMGSREVYRDLDPERDVTDFYFAHMEYDNGLIVDFEHSWICPNTDHHEKFNGVFERVAGPKGGICLNEGLFFPRQGKPEDVVNYQPKEPEGDHIEISIDRFIKSIRTGALTCSGMATGRMATYTGLLVRQAVDEKRRVELKELGYRPM